MWYFVLLVLNGVVCRIFSWTTLFYWFFCFLCILCCESKSSPSESLNKRISAIASSSKLPTLATLHSFFPLHSAPICLFAILSPTNCKRKESLSAPTWKYKPKWRHKHHVLIKSWNYMVKPHIEIAVFVFIVLCPYPSIAGYGNLDKNALSNCVWIRERTC